MASVLSLLGAFTIIRSTIRELIPQEVRAYLWNLTQRFSSEFTLVIERTHGSSSNSLFKAAAIYLGGHVLASATVFDSTGGSPQRFLVGKSENVRNFTYALDKNSEIVDLFRGVPMKWKFRLDFSATTQIETRWYELCFNKKHAEIVKSEYLPHVLDTAKRLKDQTRTVKFHIIRRDWWCPSAVNIDHPMTFETLAMDADLKKNILDDLNSFINGKEYYKKIGRLWKRGYLLYGPPGTGKSSLIAAMANHLNFDIYNLNLSAVKSDSVLEDLLLQVSNRSIIVVEDIDCTIKLQNREAGEQVDSFPRVQVTLSGLLNAIDGLLSCCANERIVVFTTNYKERIDPALLRAGRMDRHICLSYCTFSTFKQLAANYLNIFNHDHFGRVEELIENAKASPAEVAGELMKSKDPEVCLEGLIAFLESKVSQARFQITSIEDRRLEEKNGIRPKKDTENEHSSNATTFLAVGCDSVREYRVKADLALILKNVFLKHGNIVENSSLNSMQCLSSLLEVVCGIIQRLQAVEFEELTEVELESMITSVRDLEYLKVEVGWLNKRLDEITQALPLAKHCSSLKEERGKNLQDIEKMEKEVKGCEDESKSLKIQETKARTEELSEKISSIETKFNQIRDGLP
ncbi:hypothetical protein SLEP1_g49006 [Rubroshorea leprosula]|uniref:AAA+ ATPase domain-containing protein n=2 Tax=Rubroshorea leprosula TaxID=152421 RepID=A0AAV5LW79_9ROSI|nr:hypothetical protein SLEP1_g49006 [Rubroshorea leprosula]